MIITENSITMKAGVGVIVILAAVMGAVNIRKYKRAVQNIVLRRPLLKCVIKIVYWISLLLYGMI